LTPPRSFFLAVNPRVFIQWRFQSFSRLNLLSYSSTPPHGVLSSLLAALRVSSGRSPATSKGTLLEYSQPFSISGSNGPFFHNLFRDYVRKTLPCLSKGSSSGFGYPHEDTYPPTSLEDFFNLQRSWASLFRAFFLFKSQNVLSNIFSALAVARKTFPPFSSASATLPSRKSCAPLVAPQRVRLGRGLLLS
jgi:hypothetical protein